MNTFDQWPLVREMNPWMADVWDYWNDRAQRTVLFWDILRQRGNNYLAHYEAGQPPVLVFDYEMVMDGRTFDQPVNYALVRILDRRSGKKAELCPETGERRLTCDGKAVSTDGRPLRPIVVIDPRAGHGPGIGGSKFNSQIGVSLDYGHPVYFILFYTHPEPGQTISHVQKAEIRFLETVAQRHPDAPKPAVIGNCQAGWATALIGADRPDVTGPMILNGSPLSYWGGIEGANPMRYKGGLVGGVWLASLWSDLGRGQFDGAHLVAGFEDLNPANTYWTKFYNLFTHVDTEAPRFLNFEKWWGGFFLMNAEEIHFIVESLFIGNELEQGRLTLDDGRVINLKNIQDPIIAFASGGDNITPPPQALNWIKKVYGTVDEIKRCGQVIIYMVHENIGHLGIFVSGKVAQKEHRQILGSVGWLEYLSPGLYEMVLDGKPTRTGMDDYRVRFEARDMTDILTLDDGQADERAFEPVNAISRVNDHMYNSVVSPWVKLMASPLTARMIKLLHPLRFQRYMISDLNPWCIPLKPAAERVKAHRRPVGMENPYVAVENLYSESIKAGLNLFRDTRDWYQELLFKSIYSPDWLKTWFGTDNTRAAGNPIPVPAEEKRGEKHTPGHGGIKSFVDACVRIMIAVAGADDVMDTRELKAAETIIQGNKRLRKVTPAQYKRIVKEQSRIIHANPRQAVSELADLLPRQKDRQEAYDVGEKIARSDDTIGTREQVILATIREALNIKE